MFNLYLYVLDFNSFLKQNALYLALGVVGLIIVVLLLCFFLSKKNGKKEPSKIRGNKSEYIDSFGGNDNLVDYKLIGSRIEVHLKDYSKLDKEKLKSAGVDGFILMSNKLTLVLKGDAKEVYKKIFND
ncbi:MAG: hypothetical protein MR467_01450 [Bacillales bacterium]|nr:hypothetical protein [Mollicutes bacterium]MCI7212802.1 hypothetical protein [Bacillales bacterium]MDY3903826.1 hypothetical protein [Candidatus Enteromonas sp.]MCI7057707.1 hypothetical protein [Mollicutes bacterium]MDD7714949.1 hypothetical protein [Mollicutes bacterium]